MIGIGRSLVASLAIVAAGAFTLSFCDSCCPAATTKGADWPDDPVTDEARADACTRAGARLTALGCKEARPDFATFCRYELANDIPIHPQCLASITTCAEVDSKCR